jgi:hypothetical protein
MNRGAVAFLDALGFKERTRRAKDPEKVLGQMQRLRHEALAHRNAFVSAYLDKSQQDVDELGLEEPKVLFISDTIMLSLAIKKDHPNPDFGEFLCAISLGGLVADIISSAAEPALALAYRGCITCGEFAADGEFYLGPAVYEAAENMEAIEAALVWYGPSGERRLTKSHDLIHELYSRFFLRHPVPVKGGQSYETWVVSPFGNTEDDAERTAMKSKILATFGDAPSTSVAIKQQNTERFLQRHQTVLRKLGEQRVKDTTTSGRS